MTNPTNTKRNIDSVGNTAGNPTPKQAKTDSSGGMRHYYELPHPSTWTFNLRVNEKTGSTMIYINDANKRKLTFQLPRMRTPFGVREPQSTPGSEESTSRPNLDLDVDDQRLLEWGRTVDSAIVDYIVENSQSLLKSKTKKSREVVEEMFRPIIPPSNNAEYNPLMRTKFVKGTTNWATKVLVETKAGTDASPLRFRTSTIGSDDIAANDDVTPIVDLTGIWIANKNMGMSVSLSAALVHKKATQKEFNFILPSGVAGAEEESEDEVPDVTPTTAMDAPVTEPVETDPFA
jgi:hypothetical protein